MNVCFLLTSVRWKQLWYQVPLLAESCDLTCVRRRSEKRLRKTIRTLRKSINRKQFHLHFAGSDYELGKSQSQPAELPGHCVMGQVLIGKKCGKFVFLCLLNYCSSSALASLSRLSGLQERQIMEQAVLSVHTSESQLCL